VKALADSDGAKVEAPAAVVAGADAAAALSAGKAAGTAPFLFYDA
jgi:hypothetical protein